MFLITSKIIPHIFEKNTIVFLFNVQVSEKKRKHMETSVFILLLVNLLDDK